MEKLLKKITHDALALSYRDRATSARILLASIDTFAAEEVSLAWDVELEKRLLEIKKGTITGIPAQQVFAKLGAKYR